jgi:predicted nucleic acid-binding Zn ribbon protein
VSEPGYHDPRRVGEGLDRLVRALGGPSAGALSSVFDRWDEIVGERLAAHATPVSLQGGTLVVAVEEVGWATQLRYLEADLKRRVAEAAGEGSVDRIEVRVRPN